MPTAAELRALADQMEVTEAAEKEHEKAREAYEKDTSNEDLRATYKAAAKALADARQEARENTVAAVSTEPGSVTIVPATAKNKGA